MSSFREMMSQLKPYSLGIVVIDKPETSDVIQVFPSEQLPFAEGNLTTNRRMQISAHWVRIGDSNRFTSPDVYKGETVQIYRYADTDEYFWSDIMREPSLRKKERVIYAVSNIPDKGGNQTLDKSYYVEISTKDKRVHLHTSDNDGELCTYDLIIDTSKGNLTLLDGMGNILTLDSKPGNINFKINGSLYGDVAKNINLKCIDANLKASGNITAEAGSNITLTAGTKISLNAPIIEFNGSRTIGLKAPNIESEASIKISNKAPDIKSAATTAIDNSAPTVKTAASTIIDNSAPTVKTAATTTIDNSAPTVKTAATTTIDNSAPTVKTAATTTIDNSAPTINSQASTKITTTAPDVSTTASNIIEHRARVIKTDDLEVSGDIRYSGYIGRN